MSNISKKKKSRILSKSNWSQSIVSKKKIDEFCLSLSLVRKRRVEFEESLSLVSLSLISKKRRVEFEESLSLVRKEESNLKKV